MRVFSLCEFIGWKEASVEGDESLRVWETLEHETIRHEHFFSSQRLSRFFKCVFRLPHSPLYEISAKLRDCEIPRNPFKLNRHSMLTGKSLNSRKISWIKHEKVDDEIIKYHECCCFIIHKRPKNQPFEQWKLHVTILRLQKTQKCWVMLKFSLQTSPKRAND